MIMKRYVTKTKVQTVWIWKKGEYKIELQYYIRCFVIPVTDIFKILMIIDLDFLLLPYLPFWWFMRRVNRVRNEMGSLAFDQLSAQCSRPITKLSILQQLLLSISNSFCKKYRMVSGLDSWQVLMCCQDSRPDTYVFFLRELCNALFYIITYFQEGLS